MERWLDRLGAAEADSAPADLTHRLQALAPAPTPLRLADEPSDARARSEIARLGPTPIWAAAAIAVVATIGAIWLAKPSAPATATSTAVQLAQLDAEVTLWIDALEDLDAGGLGDEIDLLAAEASILESTLDGVVTSFELEGGTL